MKSKKIQQAIQDALMAQLKEVNAHIELVLLPQLVDQKESTLEILREGRELMWVIETLNRGNERV